MPDFFCLGSQYACVCVCVCVRVRTCVCACVRACVAELEVTVSHWPFPTIFRDLAEQIQFARTNLLHFFNGEANDSL